ncbi:unnamed protein product [Schistosoma intercalatum]|nr:unnamed protein product [Schistosoma intercalatum]CAH8624829.1 unnamed protein product [Schistosoma intercalatum]
MTGEDKLGIFIRDEDIWQELCLYLRKKLLMKKCVKFSNLGIFGFSHRELLLTDGVYVGVHRPVFLLSEKLCQSYGIVQRKYVIEGSIPLIQLNYSELSSQILVPREQIEDCIQNVCATLGQYLYHEKFAEVIFNDIGKLRINKKKSKFCFFNSFLSELDNTGRLAQTFQNRPESSDGVTTDRSVLSNRSHGSISSVKKRLATIDEDKPSTSPMPPLSEKTYQSKRQDDQSSTSDKVSWIDDRDIVKCNTDSLASCIHTSPIHRNNQVSKVEEVPEIVGQHESFLEEESNANPTISSPPSIVADNPELNQKSFISPDLPKLYTTDLEQYVKQSSKVKSHSSASHTSSKLSDCSRSTLSSVRSIKSNIEELEKRIPKTDDNCNHALSKNNGLCYLCHQRRIRNIHIDLKDEIKKREQAEDELLRIYQLMRENNEAKREQENLLTRRNELCKQAAFNLGVACSKRMKKSFVDPTIYQTFIMDKRPLTPLRQTKQKELKTELDNQVEQRLSGIHHLKEQELYLGKLEQVKLVKELEIQKRRMYESKLQNQSAYKEALDFQVKHKPEYLPKSENNSLGLMLRLFVDNDKKLNERNLIAKSVQEHQLKSIEKLKNQFKDKQLNEKEQEKKVLKRVQDDLVTDIVQRKQEQKAMRQYLQNEWLKASQVKHDKEVHEKLRDQAQNSLLLLEQTGKYKRCNQCQRSLDNVGQFHMTTDTYVRGKQFVI